MKHEDYLGKEVECNVTGFTGTVVAVIVYLNHCIQVCVKPKMKENGKMPDGEYIDIQQVNIINQKEEPKEEAVVLHSRRGRTGGPQPDCPKH